MTRSPALGEVPQEATSTPLSAALLPQKGMPSFWLLCKDGCGPFLLATCDETICVTLVRGDYPQWGVVNLLDSSVALALKPGL